MKIFVWSCSAFEKHVTKDNQRFAGMCPSSRREECDRKHFCVNVATVRRNKVGLHAYALCRPLASCLREITQDEWKYLHESFWHTKMPGA